MLDIADVSGSRVIETGYLPRVGVREAHAAAALEVMSRFALDPRWLLYLPPTMSPVATSTMEGLLEHPEQAFTAYHSDGVTDVLCEEKHMGSRAVLLICRTPAAAQARFSVPPPAAPAAPAAPASRAAQASPAACGAIWTRTGRPFFPAALIADLADRSVRRRNRPGCSASWTRSGCSSTPNCCPGTPRPAGCSATSTRRSGPPPEPRCPPPSPCWSRPRGARCPPMARRCTPSWTGPAPG